LSCTEASEDSHHDPQCQALVQQVCQAVPRQLMVRFIRTFLLESNVTSIRWQTHSLVHHMYSAAINQQEPLVDVMWSLWPELPSYGRKAAQFVDLLGYFLLKAPQLTENRVRHCLTCIIVLGSG
jgi:E3 ubiquitin-protein ligase UBR4